MKSQVLHQTSWARSAGGLDLELYSSSHQTSPPILFIGGVHGDEPEGVKLAHDLLFWLQKNNSDDLQSWYLIPCLNIDGFRLNERTNSNGVDLNRNFPSDDWSPEAKAPRYSPGPHPASEPETKAVVALIEKIRPSLIIHFHSWEPCVVYTGSAGKAAAEILAGHSPYQAREDIGYPTPGSLGQYGWLNHKTPVICIEEQAGENLENVWPHFGLGLESLLRSQPAKR